MADVAFVLIILAFFALAGVFVVACDRVIGVDDETSADAVEHAQSDRLAA
jgi:hypothetical protein